MPDDAEIAQAIRDAIDRGTIALGSEHAKSETDSLPNTDAGFRLTLIDGSEYIVTVTTIGEAV